MMEVVKINEPILAGDKTIIPLDELTHGVYIIKINNKSINKENNKDCPKSREKGIGKNGENRREKAGNYDCDREGGESRKAGDRQQTGENGRADGGQAGESRKICSGRGSKSCGKIPRSRRSGKEAGYKAGNKAGNKIRGKTRDKNEKKHRHE